MSCMQAGPGKKATSDFPSASGKLELEKTDEIDKADSRFESFTAPLRPCGRLRFELRCMYLLILVLYLWAGACLREWVNRLYNRP